MAQYLIAHDLGTSANKASLLDLEGRILKSHTQGYGMAQPHPGWAQQDPADWWRAFCTCTKAVLKGIDPAQVAGLAVTGQMMACLPLDAAGRVLHPAILWADTRAQAEAAQLEEAVGAATFYCTTGMRAAANYGLPKMMWLRRHAPEVYGKTAVFLPPKDYINYRLCGRMATDPENAAYLHAYDLKTGDWSDALLDAAGVLRGLMPPILPATAILGRVTEEAAQESGLAAGTPVAVSTGDGGATTLGTATIRPGEGYISLGTSSWVCVVTGSKNMDPARSISKLRYLDTWRDSGTMQAGGYSLSWLRRTLCQPEEELARQTGCDVYDHISELAAASPPGAGGVLFLPYLLGERAPLWDTRLKGAFLGMSGGTTRTDLARAVMEGVAFHMNSIYQTILATGGMQTVREMRLVGGGAQSALWQQIFADVLGVPVTTTRHPGQAGVLGTAVLAGMALGLYPSAEVVRQFQQGKDTAAPRQAHAHRYKQQYAVFLEAERALRQANHQLAALEADDAND